MTAFERPAAWRAAGAFASVAAGMVIARHSPMFDSVMWLSAACLLAAAGALVRGRLCLAILAAAGAAFGAGWFTLRIHEVPADSLIWGLGGAGSALVTVEGVVLDPPEVVEPPSDALPWLDLGPRARLTVSVHRVITAAGPRHAGGRLRVAVGEPLAGAPRAGDLVRITGSLRTVEGPLNPGQTDQRLRAAQEGRVGTLSVPRSSLIEVLPPSTSAIPAMRSAFLRFRAATTERARALLLGGFDETGESRAVLAAMVLGEEEPALGEVRSAFTRLGLAQVMAISGFNLAVMAWVALVLVRATGDRGRIEPLVVGGLVVVYLLILPAEAPILRSGVMVLALLLAEALGRRHDRLAVLAWTALALILFAPLDLWSLGFQLSFGLVAAMLALGPRFRDVLFGLRVVGGLPEADPWWHWPMERAKVGAATAILCWAVAMPIVIYHTGMVSPLALPAMLLILPLVTLMLWVAYGLLVIGMIIPAAAEPAGAALSHTADWTVALVRWADAAPGASLTLPPVSALWAFAALAIVLWWTTSGYLRHRALWGATAVILAWLALEVRYGPRLPAAVPVRIDTLAVGDGTCHLLRSGDEAMLWDCGSMRPGVGKWLVPRAVRALGGWRTPTVVLTHPNFDHYSGLLDAAGPLGVRTVLLPERFLSQAKDQPQGPAAAMLTGLASRGIAVRTIAAGDSLALGAATIRFLSPPRNAAWPLDNDHALVGLVNAPGRAPTLLLTGDVQDDAINALFASGLLPQADVLELPHHGSARESAFRFVEAVEPSVILQSTGPSRAGDARWNPWRPRRAWYTTATDGASWAELRADGTVRSGAFLRDGEESRQVK
jgi:competence protein ComEC